MIIDFDRSGTLEGFEAVLQRVASHPEVSTLLVLTADANDHRPGNTDAILQHIGKPLYGGVFPALVWGRDLLERGTIVIGSKQPAHVTVVRELSDASCDLAAQVASAVSPDARDALLFVFVDGFARRIAALVRALFEEFGLENNFIGGGAGSLSMQQKPCLLTNDGMIEDAAIVLQLGWPSGIGVSHGWEIISEPLKVTAADGTIIRELNYEPAISVYRRIVEPVAGRPVTGERFFEVAKGFPFGIRKIGSEVIVRDPLYLTPDGALVCVGEVPEGAFVHVLRGEAGRLIDAARSAGELATAAFDRSRTPMFRFLIDCISRSLFLERRFSEELAALDDGLPMLGALTLGEIANSGHEFLEFYNKTAVVGLIATH